MQKIDVRAAFLEFFKSKGHEVIESAPLVPEDATLLFTNAGMVPFKNIFTGAVPRPNPPIRTSCQTCIRAGGKHNDLDNVGYTARHHTFFEMLGNFSFGEYFKKEAIAYAWEFVTQVLKLPEQKLYVTVHESDDEAYEIWAQRVQKSHIYRFGDHDNFWAMGPTGPTGPCSEIFYDQGEEHFHSPEDKMGGDGDRFLEIWNLVFMQYERAADGTLSPLPKPSIDTGMGLERVTAILEGKFSNYDSSLFMPLINEVARLCGKPYEYESGASYRVIADHIRSVVFLLAQGVGFDKEGRGYVLRRILRRAVRHGYLLGLKEPFMWRLADKVAELMGGHYTYLNEKIVAVKEQILAEEKRFYLTISAGIELFYKELERTQNTSFSADVAFKLYDTYGFPLDLTTDMLREKGLGVDEARFDELMREQKSRAKASWKGSGDEAVVEGDFKALLEKFGENEFVGYTTTSCESKILALLDENFKQTEHLVGSGFVMLDKTPFYAQSGGQCGDTGVLGNATVSETKKFFGLNLSAVFGANLREGEVVKASIDEGRRLQVRRHHSATHLLQKALKLTLGESVSQAGSAVEADKLRFDFNFPRMLTSEEVSRVEELVNSWVASGVSAKVEVMALQEAQKCGATALFGEKYGEFVRVVTLGESKEFCGGTHVENLSEIGAFYITKESGVSAGVRRIEAVCASAAVSLGVKMREELAQIRGQFKGLDPLLGIKKLKEELAAAKQKMSERQNVKKLAFDEFGGVKVVVSEFDGDIKAKIDSVKNEFDKIVIFLASVNEGKINFACGVKGSEVNAAELVKLATSITGGGGGGRADFATAGGKDASKLNEAFTAVLVKLKSVLG